MIRNFCFLVLIVLLNCTTSELYSQYKLPFGNITLEELANKPFKNDPGADAIILSDVGVASLNYVNGFYIELERDVRIRIVNSNGFDYANIEIPYSTDDKIDNYRASTFNTGNEEKTETKIPKKNFILEKTSQSQNTLKFNFPDVHEGSVIEYSYIIRMTNSSLYSLIPWKFQSDIPTVYSSISISYPEAFGYKSIISGSGNDVKYTISKSKSLIFGEMASVNNAIWSAKNMPAFKEEPYIKSKKEHITRLSFELGSIDFPGSYYEEISPTYSGLTTKLLDREDFGTALNSNLKTVAEEITRGASDDRDKLKKIHTYLSSKILWDGSEDYTSSGSLKSILKKEKGSSADINMLLIAMLRSVNISADPIILSTRLNGSLNQYSAMLQQFNYLVAYVSIGDEFYLVDATDPLRPYYVLPFDCLNDAGRLISQYQSKFVSLRNHEKNSTSAKLNLVLDAGGNISGDLENSYQDYSAYNIRKIIKMESEEGYFDIIRSTSGNLTISDFKLENAKDPYSDLIEKCKVNVTNGAQVAGDQIILNPYISLTGTQNPFIVQERKFPVDFGCPQSSSYSLTLKIPEGYAVVEKPADLSYNEGGTDLKFDFKCVQNGNQLVISSSFIINKTLFQPSEYNSLRSFYSKLIQKQSELIVLKKSKVI
jgi:transglutaminase-like putative cysteine protease